MRTARSTRQRVTLAKTRIVRWLNSVTDNIVVPINSPEDVKEPIVPQLEYASDRFLNSVAHIVFPSSPEDQAEPETLELEYSSDVLYSVVAVFDRLPTGMPDDQEDDLWFNSGQVIDVLQEGVEGWGDGWGIGTTSPSVRGFFPRNFVRRLSAAEQARHDDRISGDKITRWVMQSKHVGSLLLADNDTLRRKPVML